VTSAGANGIDKGKILAHRFPNAGIYAVDAFHPTSLTRFEEGDDRLKGKKGDDILKADDGVVPEKVDGGKGEGDSCAADPGDNVKRCE
jgi:hypothetical protein